jgi:hypothetical protein
MKIASRLSTRAVIALLLSIAAAPGGVAAQTLRRDYLRHIKYAAERGWAEYPRVIAEWKRGVRMSELWGYDAPAQPVYLADLLGFLYLETKDRVYAERARELLVAYGELKRPYDTLENRARRVEYRGGVPALTNFFYMPAYARAYLRVRESGVLSQADRGQIERELAFSLDHIFHFPEWGAHNRAMLRAESLYYGALALASHPRAAQWKQLAATLAEDSLKQWEVEDASGYSAVWLHSLFSYADASGDAEFFESPLVRYALDYFLHLIAPHGAVADFGDSHWRGGWDRFIPVFEKAATVYRNPRYKWAAGELLRRAAELNSDAESRAAGVFNIGTGVGSVFTDACRWADDAITPAKPTSLSREVLDDIVGKKVVFRTGWEPASTFLLLNYRDEGDGGWLHRDYLRRTISVEEEKMHHGHADENSVALLMSGGSVLLRDGGYRPALPSGEWGAWRADYFHNRVVARKNKRDRSQSVFEFLRNSGAYRPVTTQKVDFLKFRDADASRTRVIDSDLGYQWDRVITHVKDGDYFIVIDGLKALRRDYFTFTNLWHTRKILSQGPQHFDTAYDRVGNETLPDAKSLLIYFPENGGGKQVGTYAEQRHFQDETAIYQTVSSHYEAGQMEVFVTVLIPHAKGADLERRMRQIRLMSVDKFPAAVGVEIDDGARRHALGVKLDWEMDLTHGGVGPRYVWERGRVRYGDFETDASFLFATRTGPEVRWAAATMTKVRYRDRALMEALPYTFGLQLDGSPPRAGYAKWRAWEDTARVGK